MLIICKSQFFLFLGNCDQGRKLFCVKEASGTIRGSAVSWFPAAAAELYWFLIYFG